VSFSDNEKVYQQVELEVSEQVRELLESRHILDDEVKLVIHNAEGSGEKLYQPGTDRYLAKLRIGNATFYVEYSAMGRGSYIVHTAYSHRSEFA